jgi:hypothetical protein
VRLGDIPSALRGRASLGGASRALRARGSALNLNLHFPTLALDGVYAYTGGRRVSPRFFPLPPPDADEVMRVLSGTARRIHRLLVTRAAGDEDALARDEPLLALLATASLRTRIATGPRAGQRWRRLGDRVEPESGQGDGDDSPGVPRIGGMSLHADVSVPARDRRRKESLCRYEARPPLAADRLEERPDGTLTLRLKTPWRDGTTHMLMERSDLLGRLVPLIPPSRSHQFRYHGILAPCASQRDLVVPVARDDGPVAGGTAEARSSIPAETAGRVSGSASGEGGPSSQELPGVDRPRADPRPGRHVWAALLRRVFEIAGQLRWPSACESEIHRDALRCPRCGSTLRLIAATATPDRRHGDSPHAAASSPPPSRIPTSRARSSTVSTCPVGHHRSVA